MPSYRMPEEKQTFSSKVLLIILGATLVVYTACGLTSNIVTGDVPNLTYLTVYVCMMVSMLLIYIAGGYKED